MTQRVIKNWTAVIWAIFWAICGIGLSLLLLLVFDGGDNRVPLVLILIFFGALAVLSWNKRFEDRQLKKLRLQVKELFERVSDPLFVRSNVAFNPLFLAALAVSREADTLRASEQGIYGKKSLRLMIEQLKPLAEAADAYRVAKAQAAKRRVFVTLPNGTPV